jgi:hypothetical protein
VNEEQIEILKLQKEKDRGRLELEDTYFHDFEFVDEDFARLEAEIEKNTSQRLDFTKKPPQKMQEQNNNAQK